MNEKLSKWSATQVCNAFDAAITETKWMIAMRMSGMIGIWVIWVFLAIWEMSGLSQILVDRYPKGKNTWFDSIAIISAGLVQFSFIANYTCMRNFRQVLKILIPKEPSPETANDPALQRFQEVLPDIRNIKKYLLINFGIMFLPSASGIITALMALWGSDLRQWVWWGVWLVLFFILANIALWTVIRKYHSKLKKWWDNNGEMIYVNKPKRTENYYMKFFR